MNWYKLDENRNPVLIGDAIEHVRWIAEYDVNGRDWRRVDQSFMIDKEGDSITVSTVFLGLDHNYGIGPPVLFETMIFGGEHDGYQERYCTWDEAVEGHEVAKKLIKSDILLDDDIEE